MWSVPAPIMNDINVQKQWYTRTACHDPAEGKGHPKALIYPSRRIHIDIPFTHTHARSKCIDIMLLHFLRMGRCLCTNQTRKFRIFKSHVREGLQTKVRPARGVLDPTPGGDPPQDTNPIPSAHPLPTQLNPEIGGAWLDYCPESWGTWSHGRMPKIRRLDGRFRPAAIKCQGDMFDQTDVLWCSVMFHIVPSGVQFRWDWARHKMQSELSKVWWQ